MEGLGGCMRSPSALVITFYSCKIFSSGIQKNIRGTESQLLSTVSLEIPLLVSCM